MENKGWEKRRNITAKLNQAAKNRDYDYSAYLRAQNQYKSDLLAWGEEYPELAKEEARDRAEMVASETSRHQQVIRASFVSRNLD